MDARRGLFASGDDLLVLPDEEAQAAGRVAPLQRERRQREREEGRRGQPERGREVVHGELERSRLLMSLLILVRLLQALLLVVKRAEVRQLYGHEVQDPPFQAHILLLDLDGRGGNIGVGIDDVGLLALTRHRRGSLVVECGTSKQGEEI